MKEEKLTDFAMTLDRPASPRERSPRHAWLRPLLVGCLVAIGAQIGVGWVANGHHGVSPRAHQPYSLNRAG
jgi:hypothetical protein